MTDGKGLVVVAEDDPAVASLLRLYLSRDGFGVQTYGNGTAALQAIRSHRPVAVVLDIGLPGIDGIEVCRRLRAAGDGTPVLFVTARDDEIDRVLGLELGADDYVTKPFSPRELVARVHAVLRRAEAGPERSQRRELGAVVLDLEQRRVWNAGTEVALTPTEFQLLAHLLRQPGRVWEREELLGAVWGYGHDGYDHTVNSHINRLRDKLGDARFIHTVWGVGYRFEVTA